MRESMSGEGGCAGGEAEADSVSQDPGRHLTH